MKVAFDPFFPALVYFPYGTTFRIYLHPDQLDLWIDSSPNSRLRVLSSTVLGILLIRHYSSRGILQENLP